MRRPWVRDGYAFVALFSLWNGDGMRDLLSWWGFSALSLALLAGGIVILVHERWALRRLLKRWHAVPILLFLALCLVSAAWSAYPLYTLLGCFIQLATSTVAVALVLTAPRRRLVAILALMLHVHLALSIVFEVAVALSPAHRLLPLFTSYGANVPGAYYWSQGLIFTGQRIQGIAANANLTCFLALLALIVLAVLVRAGAVRPRLWVPAALLDLLMVALTRSATVIITGALVVATALIVLGWRRFGRSGRIGLAVAGVGALGLIVLGSSRVFEPVLRVLGRGDDATGRFEIWRLVGTQLIEQRPVLGWGWIGYWVPWIEPFRGLVIRDGVQYLQAHNAYLDIQMQLGVPGLLALVLVVGSVVHRSLLLALVPRPYTVLPLLLLVALLTQGLAESRLLIEGNWATLVMLSLAVPALTRRAVPAVTPEHGSPAAIEA